MNNSSSYFVEYLSLRAWIFQIWPRLIAKRFQQFGSKIECFVIDSSKFAMLLAKVCGLAINARVEKCDFNMLDVRDEVGDQAYAKIYYRGLAEVQLEIDADHGWSEMIQSGQLNDRLPMFLVKNLGGSDNRGVRGSMFRSLFLVMVCAWKTKHSIEGNGLSVLFLGRHPWMGQICKYAEKYQVNIVSVHPVQDTHARILRLVPTNMLTLLRSIRYNGFRRTLFRWQQKAIQEKASFSKKNGGSLKPGAPVSVRESLAPVVATDFYGQLNLDRPELNSDLFFWQQSAIKGNDLLLNLRFAVFRLNRQEWCELSKNGISLVAHHPGVTDVLSVPISDNNHRSKPNKRHTFSSYLNGMESQWLREKIADYHSQRSFWADLFAKDNVKVYTTWYKNGPAHCAIADAMQSVGGVTALYQRSYDPLPCPPNAVSSEIYFAFSPANAEVERIVGSDIKYHVSTGYLGDHRFELLKEHAQSIRETLQSNGAKYVMAYFDQNTLDDYRWAPGHQFMRENYAFLLEKVLAEPWFGLMIKPHAPGLYRKNLGPVNALLERAEATGRCFTFDEGETTGRFPPAVAALGSDIAVHGHLYGATAGMESALAGIPTLLLDREGLSISPLYRLGVGKVVFNDCESLWEACQQHYSAGEGPPGLGDWTPLLDDLDPFRDGRAAERMGTYIQWLIEGFRAGLDRDTIMANAAERYCSNWGNDKITQIDARELVNGAQV